MVKPDKQAGDDRRCITRRGLLRAGFALGGLGVCALAGNVVSAYAVEEGDSVRYAVGKEIRYTGSAFTNIMYCDDAIAYCAWPRKYTPAEGTYAVEVARCRNTSGSPDSEVGWTYEIADTMLRATMWFGYGGPGFDPDVFPPEPWDGGSWTDDKYYVVTHLNESCYYLWDGGVQAQWGVSQSFKQWAERWIYGPSSGHAPDCMEQKMSTRAGEIPGWFKVYAINQDQASTQAVIFAAGEPTGEASLAKSALQQPWL